MRFKTGLGYDVHQLAEGRKLILCGVEIPYHRGLSGHSDADVAIHALIDALLGAAAAGDIGALFPDTDSKFKDIDSTLLLAEALNVISLKGYRLENTDITIVAQEPKLRPYIDAMRARLAEVIKSDIDDISVKATTTEHLGFTGRKEGIAAFATVLISQDNH